MTVAIEKLLAILDLEILGQDIFLGKSSEDGRQRVFGGQVIGQALVAVGKTVEDRHVHSLHCYFMRPGDPGVPITYQVERIRDGKSFTTRRVVALQHNKAIFSMSASFHKEEAGLSHQIQMPDVPLPDKLFSEEQLKQQFASQLPKNVRTYWDRERPVEVRLVDLTRYITSEPRKAEQHIWMRAKAKLPDDDHLHRCILAYASDFSLLDTALIAHGTSIFNPKLMLASLDHAIWFHRSFRADDWLLYSQDSPTTGGSRGFSRGSIFDVKGNLVASIAQEGLIRQKTEESSNT